MAALAIPTDDFEGKVVIDQVTADAIQAPLPAVASAAAEPPAESKPNLKLTPPVLAPENSNKPGEPDWVTHSGVEGRPYLTEEIYDSEDKIELTGQDRCKSCIEHDRSCVTILKFPNPPVSGDFDVCGYCAKEGKKRCGAGKNAYHSHLRKQIEEEAKLPISKRTGRRISTKPAGPLPPDMSKSPNSAGAALTSATPIITGTTRRRSDSLDTTDSQASAPKRQKTKSVAIRKKPGPKPKGTSAVPKEAVKVSSTPANLRITDENDPRYDGRKDPNKVAARVEKMKATLLAKKLATQAARSAEKPRAIAASARASDAPQTDPKPRAGALHNLKKPRALGRTPSKKAQALSDSRSTNADDYLKKDFVGTSTAPRGGRRKKLTHEQVIQSRVPANRQARRAKPRGGSPSEVGMQVNALLGSIERPEGMEPDGSDASSDLSSFGDLENENEKLKKTLAKYEAREKKQKLKEDNEVLRKKIEELKRQSISRRDSSSMLT